MDLSFSEVERAFRMEVRSFIAANLAPETRHKLMQGRVPTAAEVIAWQRTLNRRGWATPSWPSDHGGPGWSPVERYIFLDELHQAPAPEPLSFNVSMIGPTLIRYGSDEQKQRFLSASANADIWWAQGFSEPGAGSDLAALRTTARREGGHYVVNGHKLWQGMAHHADWMFTLVRSDPAVPKRQMGISFLLIDLKAPGVSIRPIITIDGRHEVNEVFLDDVRVPIADRLGDEHAGWEIAKYLLSNERTGIARIGMTKHLLRRARAIATPATRQRVASRAAAIEAELRVLEVTALRILDAQRHMRDADPRSSILKLKGVALRQAASELLLFAAGPAALEVQPEHGDADCEDEHWPGMIAPNYFILRAASIYGGASEIQKTIVARTLLGLG